MALLAVSLSSNLSMATALEDSDAVPSPESAAAADPQPEAAGDPDATASAESAAAADPQPETETVFYTAEEAEALELGCDFVTDPNGEWMECVDGKPPIYREPWPWKVSNFGLVENQSRPVLYGTSLVSLTIKKTLKSVVDDEPLAPNVFAGGHLAWPVSFDGKTATYQVAWRQSGYVWLEVSSRPVQRILVYVNPRPSKLNPIIQSGMNQFLAWGDGLPQLSADTAVWVPKAEEYRIREGSNNIWTGGMNMPGQGSYEDDPNDPAVRLRIEQWLAYPTITGNIRFSYEFPTQVVIGKNRVVTVTTTYASEEIPVYHPSNLGPDHAGVPSGPLAVIPRTEVPRPLMIEGDPCQRVALTITYSGDEQYSPASTQMPVEFCPARRQ
jgi:hypothetical protein